MTNSRAWGLGLGAWGLGLGACLLALAPIAAQEPERTSTPGLHDGVVVDPASQTAFVMSTEGGIDALDLASGKVRWKSRAAARPLMMVDGLLVAQAPPGEGREFVLVALAAAGGAERRRFTVDLPEGVQARVAAGPAEAFKLRTFVAGGAPIVAWTFESRPLRGVAPGREAPPLGQAPASLARAAAAAKPETEGAVQVDVSAGRAVPVAISPGEAAAGRSQLAALAGAAGSRRLGSVDERHVLVSEPSIDAANWRTPYRWIIADAAGATLGTFDSAVSMARFIVLGSRLFYVAQPEARRAGAVMTTEPLRLRALDVRAGTELWAVPVADTAYRGKMAP
jgi:hypothetical protein